MRHATYPAGAFCTETLPRPDLTPSPATLPAQRRHHLYPPSPPPPALAALVEGMELRNKSVPGVRGNGRGMAYGKLYFRGQKSVTMWRRIASDNE